MAARKIPKRPPVGSVKPPPPSPPITLRADCRSTLEVTISRTSSGHGEYMQIASPGAIPVNIVLIAGKIVVKDGR